MGVRSSELGVSAGQLRSFENLIVWQESQSLAVEVYRLTKNFPKEEVFGITSQIRRASSSVSANIAEGFGRSTTKDKLQFMTIAYGSLLETKNFIYLATKLGYMTDESQVETVEHIVRCQRLLNGFKRSLAS